MIFGNAILVYLVAGFISRDLLGLYYATLAILYIAGLVWRYKLFIRETYQELNEVFHQSLYLQLIFDGALIVWLLVS